MLEKIIHLDKNLFVFLNGLGSPDFDSFWLFLTNQFSWSPFFLIIFYLLQQKVGWKNFGYYIFFIAFLILVSDQTANLFKHIFHRIRPCNDEEIKNIIRIVKQSSSYSYYSGHASNSMATSVFTFLIGKKIYKHFYLIFIFPLLFGFSRIYLGLHFPLDVITGYTFGIIYGTLFYQLFVWFQKKNILKIQ